MHLHLKVLKLSIIRSCSSYIISDGCEALTLVFCGNKQILLYLLLWTFSMVLPAGCCKQYVVASFMLQKRLPKRNGSLSRSLKKEAKNA